MKLEHIDCSTAHEAFASKLLNNPKTYFLNGKWGSGKTTFLQEIENKHNIKLIEINLWKTDAKGSIYAHAFYKLNRFLFWFLLLLIFGIIICASSKFTGSILVVFAISILALGKYFLPTPDNLYLWLLKHFTLHTLSDKRFIPKIISDYSPYSWVGVNFIKNVTKKVIIFDDFDRADPKIQNQAYILFNILRQNPLLSIVFIGDYSKIERTNDGFIQKIIDERIELPYEIEPQNIWDEYFKNLESQIEIIDIKIDSQFQQFFIIEERNLRDRKQFSECVEYELFTLSLFDKVDLNQKLLIIYAYLFHYDKYLQIKQGNLDLLPTKGYKKYLKSKSSKDIWGNYLFSDFGDFAYHTLNFKNNNNFPKPFNYPENNVRDYLMHQKSNSIGLINAKEIIMENGKQLEEYLENPLSSDFSLIISSILKSESTDLIDIIEKKSIALYQKNKTGHTLINILKNIFSNEFSNINDLIRETTPQRRDIRDGYKNTLKEILIEHFKNDKELTQTSTIISAHFKSQIHEKLKHDTGYNILTDESFETIGEIWLEILKKYGIKDIHTQIIFLKNWAKYSYKDLSKMYNPLSINEIEKLKDKENSSILLLHYLSAQNLWGKMSDWDDNIKIIIENFDTQNFIHFWEKQSMLQQALPYHEKKYIVAFSGDDISNEDKIEAKKLIISKKEELLKNNITLIIPEDTSQ